MKKYLWLTKNDRGELLPYAILECGDETAKMIENLRKKKLWRFIADKLHEKYPNEFPSWLDEGGKRRVFWYNNVLEDYDKIYNRLVKEEVEAIEDNIDYNFEYNFHEMIMYGIIGIIDDEKAIRETAERKIDKEFENLSVYLI